MGVVAIKAWQAPKPRCPSLPESLALFASLALVQSAAGRGYGGADDAGIVLQGGRYHLGPEALE